jgi:hypothetical protein
MRNSLLMAVLILPCHIHAAEEAATRLGQKPNEKDGGNDELLHLADR